MCMTLAPHASAGVCMAMHAMDHSAHGAPAATPGATQNESLFDILKRRYALGEIDQTQFEEMKRVLSVDTRAEMPAAHAHG